MGRWAAAVGAVAGLALETAFAGVRLRSPDERRRPSAARRPGPCDRLTIASARHRAADGDSDGRVHDDRPAMTEIACRHCGAREALEREQVRVEGTDAFLQCSTCRAEFPVRRSDATAHDDERVIGHDPIEESDSVRIAARLSHR
jgi:hypothetical protein